MHWLTFFIFVWYVWWYGGTDVGEDFFDGCTFLIMTVILCYRILMPV